MTALSHKFWAIVWNRDGAEKGRVYGMTHDEVEQRAEALAGEPIDFIWKDRHEQTQ